MCVCLCVWTCYLQPQLLSKGRVLFSERLILGVASLMGLDTLQGGLDMNRGSKDRTALLLKVRRVCTPRTPSRAREIGGAENRKIKEQSPTQQEAEALSLGVAKVLWKTGTPFITEFVSLWVCYICGSHEIDWGDGGHSGGVESTSEFSCFGTKTGTYTVRQIPALS